MAEVTVRELYTYPVKGCGGGPVEELVLTERGIEGDREYSFVGENGLLVDQKKTPILASVSAELSGRGLLLRHALKAPTSTVPAWKEIRFLALGSLMSSKGSIREMKSPSGYRTSSKRRFA